MQSCFFINHYNFSYQNLHTYVLKRLCIRNVQCIVYVYVQEFCTFLQVVQQYCTFLYPGENETGSRESESKKEIERSSPPPSDQEDHTSSRVDNLVSVGGLVSEPPSPSPCKRPLLLSRRPGVQTDKIGLKKAYNVGVCDRDCQHYIYLGEMIGYISLSLAGNFSYFGKLIWEN